VLFVQKITTLVLGVVLLGVGTFAAYIGYTIHEQSSAKYNHEVEQMRKQIVITTSIVSTSCTISAIFFFINYAERGETMT
jgi:hypothetical protein